MAAEDDPFGAFGDDDSDSDQSEDDENTKSLAASLLQKANTKNNTVGSNSYEKTELLVHPKDGAAPAASPTVDLNTLQACQLSWDPPLYISPNVKLVSNLLVGGERGYVAMANLEPGTLVLVERPTMEWTDEQLGKALNLRSVKYLLSHPNAANIVHDMEDFHPTKMAVDASTSSENPEQIEHMMAKLQEKHDKDTLLSELVELSANRNIQNRNGTPLIFTDILRLLLALRYNGLESGLYNHVAMLNHKCQPNCVKFLPTSEDPTIPSDYSEVRTTRFVSAGESLTISYISGVPRLMSHASRRRHLWEQHRFDIGVELDVNLRRMEIVNGNLPSSSKEFVDDNAVTCRIERTIAEMDLLYQSTRDSMSYKKVSDESWEQAKALEVSSLELYVEAKSQLQNENHLLLIPCLTLHLDSCDLVLRHDAKTSSLTIAQRCKLLGRHISTANRLVQLQNTYWGKDHFDLARTYLDMAHAIEELLSKSPKQIMELDIATSNNKTKTFRDWSTLEFECRTEHERIKSLYPRDAARHLK